jgi:hypothetical protein
MDRLGDNLTGQSSGRPPSDRARVLLEISCESTPWSFPLIKTL